MGTARFAEAMSRDCDLRQIRSQEQSCAAIPTNLSRCLSDFRHKRAAQRPHYASWSVTDLVRTFHRILVDLRMTNIALQVRSTTTLPQLNVTSLRFTRRALHDSDCKTSSTRRWWGIIQRICRWCGFARRSASLSLSKTTENHHRG